MKRLAFPQTKASTRGRFRRYRRESGGLKRQADVQESQGLRAIMQAWMRWDKGLRKEYLADDCGKDSEAFFQLGCGLLEGRGIDGRDVELFSLSLSDMEVDNPFDKVGLFFSALAGVCDERGFRVDTRAWPFSGTVSLMCYRNSTDVVIDGYAGAVLGRKMSGGSITVNGDTGIDLCSGMEGGIVTINGDVLLDVGDRIGSGMSGGVIHINGDVIEVDERWHSDKERSKSLGRRLHELEETLKNLEGGRLFHKGRLIIDR